MILPVRLALLLALLLTVDESRIRRKEPARAAFVLVRDPAKVDTRIDVQRPELPHAACPAEVQRADPLPDDTATA